MIHTFWQMMKHIWWSHLSLCVRTRQREAIALEIQKRRRRRSIGSGTILLSQQMVSNWIVLYYIFNSIRIICFHLSHNTKNNLQSRECVSRDKHERCGCHQRTYSMWLMAPTRLQENNYLEKSDHKEREKRDQKLCTWNPLCVRNSNSPAEWSRHRIAQARITVAMHQCPMAKRSHWPGQTDEYDVSLCRRMDESHTLYRVNGI